MEACHVVASSNRSPRCHAEQERWSEKGRSFQHESNTSLLMWPRLRVLAPESARVATWVERCSAGSVFKCSTCERSSDMSQRYRNEKKRKLQWGVWFFKAVMLTAKGAMKEEEEEEGCFMAGACGRNGRPLGGLTSILSLYINHTDWTARMSCRIYQNSLTESQFHPSLVPGVLGLLPPYLPWKVSASDIIPLLFFWLQSLVALAIISLHKTEKGCYFYLFKYL